MGVLMTTNSAGFDVIVLNNSLRGYVSWEDCYKLFQMFSIKPVFGDFFVGQNSNSLFSFVQFVSQFSILIV